MIGISIENSKNKQGDNFAIYKDGVLVSTEINTRRGLAFLLSHASTMSEVYEKDPENYKIKLMFLVTLMCVGFGV